MSKDDEHINGGTTKLDDYIRVTRYGPVETLAGTRFNVQPEGLSALWFEVEGRLNCVLAVEFDGTYIKAVRQGKIFSALVPSALIEVPRRLYIRVIDEARPDQVVQIDFHVREHKGYPRLKRETSLNFAEPKIPNFFMIGPPRGGTTSIYWQLSGHPDSTCHA
jgi:hypothetical protein